MSHTAIDDLVARVTALLHDAGNVRWSAADLIEWINDGQTEIIRKHPTAYPTTAVMDMEEGTKQVIPDDGFAFIKILRNVSVIDEGLSVPRRISMELLDIEDPNWHNAAPTELVDEYMVDPGVPKIFYVSPPSIAVGSRCEIQYSIAPPRAATGDDLALDDIYNNALMEYAQYRAFDRDSEDGGEGNAMKHYGAFKAHLE